jgi:hypothetical protein
MASKESLPQRLVFFSTIRSTDGPFCLASVGLVLIAIAFHVLILMASIL